MRPMSAASPMARRLCRGGLIALATSCFAFAAPEAQAASTKKGEKPSEIKTTSSSEWWIDVNGKKLTPFNPAQQSAQTKPNGPGKPPGAVSHATFTTVITEYDPPADVILSGRLTLAYNPVDTIDFLGWYGEFGEDPTLAAPPVDGDAFSDAALLQYYANPLMASSSITVDPIAHRIVFFFDWGPGGFAPTLNVNGDGHFNFAGVSVTPGAGSDGSLKMVFSKADLLANGTDAQTYLLCSGGYCGSLTPEPQAWALMILGFGLAGWGLRRSRRLGGAQAETPTAS